MVVKKDSIPSPPAAYFQVRFYTKSLTLALSLRGREVGE